MLCVQDRLDKTRKILAEIKVAKVKALTHPSFLPNKFASVKAKIIINKMLKPWSKLIFNMRLSKKDLFRARGGRFITFFSAGSASNKIEQTGSVINSKNTIWIGNKISGHLKIIGKSVMPAIGI